MKLNAMAESMRRVKTPMPVRANPIVKRRDVLNAFRHAQDKRMEFSPDRRPAVFGAIELGPVLRTVLHFEGDEYEAVYSIGDWKYSALFERLNRENLTTIDRDAAAQFARDSHG